MIHLEEFGIPRPGWPGRRRAIARLVLELAVNGAVFVLLLVALFGLVLLTAAATDALP